MPDEAGEVFLHMWQGGLQGKMPELEFKGEGWGVEPTRKADGQGRASNRGQLGHGAA